jgi:ABC-2 type transport system permease protein
VGVFVSAGTENQLTSALVSFFSLLMIWLIDPISNSLPVNLTAGIIFAALLVVALCGYIYLNTKNLYITAAVFLLGAIIIAASYFIDKVVFIGFMRKFFSWFSLNKRYENFSMGLLKVDSLVYYLSFTGLFLFLTVRLIEKQRWV